MKIYKDILSILRIESVYIIADGMVYMCIPLEIKNNIWFVSTETDGLSGDIMLKVKFNGSFIYMQARIKRENQEYLNSFTYELEINPEEKKKDNFKFVFFTMITEMEEKAEEWNKRSENRYEIGLDEEKLQAICFKGPEQIIVADKLQLPCVVNNLSYSGAKITTLEGNFQKDKKVCLYLSFIRPIEQIPIIANVKNCFLKTTAESKNVSVMSLQFENAPYEYKKRLDDFIKFTGQ